MKNILAYTLITLALSSCLELLDDVPQSFERVYGSEGTSTVHGMIMRNNGHLLLFGEEVKPAFKDGADVSLPFILETDEFGNEVRFRNYGFYEGEFDINLTSWDEIDPGWYGTNKFVTSRAFIFEVKQLNNGGFFCLGRFPFRPKNTWWPSNYDETDLFYALLDKNLEPVKWGFFNDTELEGPGQYWHALGVVNDIHELPTGDIVFHAPNYWEWDNNGVVINKGFAIYKFSPSTEIMNIWRYPGPGQARGLVLDTDGSSLVMTVNTSEDISGNFGIITETSLFRIDLTSSSGGILNTVKYNTRGLSWNLAHSKNGYVVKVYHPNSLTTDDEEIARANDREWWGSLLFVNANLDSLELVNITETYNIETGIYSFIQTRDGGYVAEFQKNALNGLASVLIKTDPDGNVLWRYEESDNTEIIDIVEMDDGGIAYAVRRDYNGIGRRVTLVKLTADGKL